MDLKKGVFTKKKKLQDLDIYQKNLKIKKNKVKKMIQWSHISKKMNKEKILELQNEQRKKYGLRPLKRLELETFLYFLNDDKLQRKPQYINPKYDGGMYQ